MQQQQQNQRDFYDLERQLLGLQDQLPSVSRRAGRRVDCAAAWKEAIWEELKGVVCDVFVFFFLDFNVPKDLMSIKAFEKTVF